MVPFAAVGRAKLPGPAPPPAGPAAFSTTVPGTASEVTSKPASFVPPSGAVAVTATWLWSPAGTVTVAENAPEGPAVSDDTAAVPSGTWMSDTMTSTRAPGAAVPVTVTVVPLTVACGGLASSATARGCVRP